MKWLPVCVFPIVLTIGGAAGLAQSPNMLSPMASYSMGMMNNAMLSAPLYQQMDVMNRKARGQTRPSAPAPAADLAFAPGDGTQAVAAYVGRISRQDPAAGAQLRTALAGQNVPAIFGQLVAPFGLTDHDVADAMAAHLIMRAMVATGVPPPSAEGVRNVRDAVARAMAHDPKMASAAYRSEVGGQAQLDFVLVNATWRAIGAGKWPADAAAQYRQGVAAGLVREGVDLNSVRLTAEGFVPE